jgi:diaminopimelate decarboxylase
MVVKSPNLSVQPASAVVSPEGHLMIGGLDVVKLAEEYGTPLWILDEQTILESIAAYKQGLEGYPDWRVLYAGKAFLSLAICHLIGKQGLGLDVVSAGELYTAIKADLPADLIYMHGNNKSEDEVREGLAYGDVKIVVDNESELEMVASLAADLGKQAKILLRVIPGVEPDTHQHIVTGHHESKFGTPLECLSNLIEKAKSLGNHLSLTGLHCHIGSQSHEMGPYAEAIDVLADSCLSIKKSFQLELPELDVGGGLGIAYTEDDRPTPIYDWTRKIADRVASAFKERALKLPRLLVEPGRSIVGTAGVTLYRAGHKKELPSGLTFLAVDGGMADNPRPITYDAKYTAVVANRMTAPPAPNPVTLVGKYCESGDIIIKETWLNAGSGDLIAVFGTGAYNFSMASNYNRTGRPACLLVSHAQAELIISRESRDDLLRHDLVPARLLR